MRRNEQIQKMEELINSKNFESALFEAGLIDDFMMSEGFDHHYESLPEWLSELIDNGDAEYEGFFDKDYWGSDSVIQVRIHARGEEWNEKIEEWKEDNEDIYNSWCSKAESLIWKHIQQQKNFYIFDMAMKGERI